MFVQRSFAAPEREGKGTLYLVATPIGNLQDMTPRAVETLRSVDLIAAEDTRETRKLLTHFQINTKLVSYHEHNAQESGPELIRLLLAGRSVAVVSDAGLPAISDPGAALVRAAVEQHIGVVAIPGANAALTALIASGLPTERFVFLGFLPREKERRLQELKRVKEYPETLVFYEAPHRLLSTLEQLAEVFGPRRVALARELTKKFEEFIRGELGDVIASLREREALRGEFTVIVEGYKQGGGEEKRETPWWEHLSPVEHVEHYVREGMATKDAIKRAALDRALPKREIYRLYHREK
ncbi:16S rRNA (cytidine(1402)-2'-O)-methyltransferase [Bacillaceae bacterium]